MCDTPIIFFIFNRPDVTARVFEAIRAIRPTRLLVVADGPRADRAGEVERCEQARAIVQQIDWPCTLEKRYSTSNLGCGRCVSSGIQWAFGSCDHAIILEDDCLPHPDFFRFCRELLIRYACDSRIAHIGGDAFHGNTIPMPSSYYFTRFPHVWGWATWRRAWEKYDFEMRDWPVLRDSGAMNRWFTDPVERAFWKESFDRVFNGQVDTWDIQWSYALLKQNRLAINPAHNLISNIGFGPEATHTRGKSWMSNLPLQSIGDIRHPSQISANAAADAWTFNVVFDGARFRRRNVDQAKGVRS